MDENSLLLDEIEHENIGTLFPTPAIQKIVCKVADEAMASNAALYFFHKYSVEEKEQELIFDGKPVTKQQVPVWSSNESIEDFAKETAQSHREDFKNAKQGEEEGILLGLSGQTFYFLPLDLADNTIGVFVFEYSSREAFFGDAEKIVNLRAANWRIQLSLPRLLLKNRFSAFMRLLRNDIADTRNVIKERAKACNAFQAEQKSYTESFIEEALSRCAIRLDPVACMLTTVTRPKTGPERLERYICQRDDTEDWIVDNYTEDWIVDNYGFFERKLSGPCRIACEEKRPVIIKGDRCKNKDLDNVEREINEESDRLEGMGMHAESKRLRSMGQHIRGSSECPSTMLIMPVLESSQENGDAQRQAAFCLILPGEHLFDPFHKILATEVGSLLAETLAQVRSLERRRLNESYKRHLDKRRQSFESAKSADDIIGAFFHHIGSPPPGHDDPDKFWRVADDAVIWGLNPYSASLEARSGKGKSLDALERSEKLVVLFDQHPLMRKEEIRLSKGKTWEPPILEKKFRLWTFKIHQEGKQKLLMQAYARTKKRWMISFPLVDTSDKLYGIVDLLRDEPLPLEEGEELKNLFHRLSRQLSSAVNRCNLVRANNITERLFAVAATHIGDFQIAKIYSKLAKILAEEFNCEQCDIIYNRHEQTLLHASSIIDAPLNDDGRSRYWLLPDERSGEILAKCLRTKAPQIDHDTERESAYKHMSGALAELLSKGGYSRAMAIPLKMTIENQEEVVGLVLMQSPKKVPKLGLELGHVKKSQIFTVEDVYLGKQVGLALRRILKMVFLAEQPSWLMMELSHSLGQPLHVLRGTINQVFRLLSKILRENSSDVQETTDLIMETNHGFDTVHDATRQLSLFCRLSTGEISHDYEAVDLKRLVIQCCEFMTRSARLGNNRIVYENVRNIALMPIQKDWLKKALINILDNARKYSWEKREISVGLKEENDRVVIEVINYGIGVPEADIGMVFQPYFRSKIPDARGTRKGTGIGLALVKQAVKDIHKGTVVLTSEPKWDSDRRLIEERNSIADIEHETRVIVTISRSELESLVNQA